MNDAETTFQTAKTRKSPREAAAVLMRMNETLRSKLMKAEAEIDEMQERIRDLKQDNYALRTEQSALSEEVMLASMHLAGIEAELQAFHEEAAYCRLMDKSQEQFTDGSFKTHGRLIYEGAFDEEGVRQGVGNPQSYRPL